MPNSYSEIERANRILLHKMSDIMKKSWVDNKNTSTRFSHSLNDDYRKRELVKIAAENTVFISCLLHGK